MTWDDWKNDHPDNYFGTAEAKQAFFLDSKDLKCLPYKTFGGGIGCGAPYRLYEPEDLKLAAELKHGPGGLEKKIALRAKRFENKRKRAAKAAEEARKQILEKQEEERKEVVPSKRPKKSSSNIQEDKLLKTLHPLVS